MKTFIVFALLGMVLSACTPADEQERTDDNGQASQNTVVEETQQPDYEGTGVVRSITPSKSHIVLRHDEIEGYMSAMIMPFELADTSFVAGVSVDDSVSFTLTVAGSTARVSDLTVIEE